MVLSFAAACQWWVVGVLLLSRQGKALLLVSITGCVLWSWCFGAYFLRKRRLGLVLTGCCLAVNLALGVLCLLDLLDKSGAHLLGG